MRSRAQKRQLVAAIALPFLVLAVATNSLGANPKVVAASQGFRQQNLEVSVSTLKMGLLEAHIDQPANLASSGLLAVPASMPLLRCPQQTWKGKFLLTPPSGKFDPLVQFLLRPIGLPKVSCKRSPAAAFQVIGQAARDRIQASTNGVSAAAKGLVLGITDGDTSLLPLDVQDQFKTLSLTHLNAVSGTNCSIVVALVLALLIRFGASRKWRLVGSALGLCAYLVLVGNQPSVFRAAIMGLIVLAGLSLGSRFPARNALALAVLALLLIEPQYALDYGFALSVLATLGVIELAPRVDRYFSRWLPKGLSLVLAVALSAQLACLPVLVLLQPKFGLLGIAANILAEPVVPAITVLGVVGALAAILGLSSLAGSIFWVASLPAQYLIALAKFLATASVTIDLPIRIGGVCVAVVILLSVLAITSSHIRLKAAGIAVLLVAVALSSILVIQGALKAKSFASGDWFYVACDVGQGDGTVIRSGTHIAVIDVGRDPKPIDACLKRLGVTHIELLVLTHFDLDHVGGVAGALAGRKIDSAMLTSFVDDRPGAVATQQTIEQAGIPITLAEKGMVGTLGGFNWLVLSPHHAGQDSEDSNDGSITMYWASKSVRIITMADLPAKGQMRLAEERSEWWQPEMLNLPLILKVSHHGSADQFPEFIQWLHPLVATISVGLGNSYGHPTAFTLDLLRSCSNLVLRTDQLGSISLSFDSLGHLTWGSSGSG
jgi:competence protein ComEC